MECKINCLSCTISDLIPQIVIRDKNYTKTFKQIISKLKLNLKQIITIVQFPILLFEEL